MPKERLLFDIEDSKERMGKAIIGSFLAVLSILFIQYLIYCLEDNALLSMTNVFTYYSHGEMSNEILGLWAVSFTPISSLGTIAPEWFNDWILFIAPAMIAGLCIAVKTKSVKWSLVGGLFFILWGILLPMIFVYILPIFGIVDPTSVNSGLISAYSGVYEGFNPFYLSIINLFQSVFMGWCIAGSIELAGLAVIFAIPFSLIFGILQKLFQK